MIPRNPMQFKALVKNMAKEKGISAHLVMQNYMLERLLERISISRYRTNFILKGGFLISSIVGLDTRTTMDLDATVKGFPLTSDLISKVFIELCNISIEDAITFEYINCENIREADDYPGIRVSLRAIYQTLVVHLKIDITSGDRITPSEIEYELPLMFDDKKIHVLAYNLESIFAEKIETILSRGIANTRPRDFYDIYILRTLRSKQYTATVLKQALEETMSKRGSSALLSQYELIIREIESDTQMNQYWNKYQDIYAYAKDIDFSRVCDAIRELCRESFPS